MNYDHFLAAKRIVLPPTGIEPEPINPQLFQFQRDIVRWALRRGRAAIFADCGMGKSPMQLEWARQISKRGNVLILAPLAVAEQTVAEGVKFGVTVRYCRDQSEVQDGITITNYEMLEHFDPGAYVGIVLDESSVLKDYTSKTRNLIISSFQATPYRLACTATPAPNDHMELGNHAEFLGAMSRTEMLSMFFVHDGGDTSKWRLKGHAQQEFWNWVCSWAVMLRKPSDLGYDDGAFILPPLQIEQAIVAGAPLDGYLFAMAASTLQERIKARKTSTTDRVRHCAEIVNATDESWVIWCNLNDEANQLEDLIEGGVQVQGSDPREQKIERLRDFAAGKIKRIISKPSIAGRGLNWHHCHNVAFVGLSDSWEDYYQAVRRVWRFGQTQPVRVVLITAETEGSVLANIMRKEKDADKMATEMINNMHTINEENIKGTVRTVDSYKTATVSGEGWEMHLGDCVDVVRGLPDCSIDYSLFSPPFASLYVYSASERDMGNVRSYDEFGEHFGFLVKELFRVLKAGRLVSFHCWNIPTSKSKDGYIGIQDFRGDLIRMFLAEGFIYHSEVCIWKDPVTAMQRTKALGLLWKQLKKDSSMSRQGIPDYLVTMRKPGENREFIAHSAESFPVDQWQQWASPVWMDINPSDTLQFRSAREHKDERHIAPLQLEVIRRALVLWSNPGDVVLSPFAGIGSEGYMALGGGTITEAAVDAPRKFIGVELKESYFRQATKNLAAAQGSHQRDLFALAEEEPEGEVAAA